MKNIEDIDSYISQFPSDVQEILQKVRHTISSAAPLAKECISYSMPTFTLNGNLVHFAAHKAHLGFYPTPSAIVHFTPDLAGYKYSKGSIQFPYNDEIPYQLIAKMVEYRVKEQLERE